MAHGSNEYRYSVQVLYPVVVTRKEKPVNGETLISSNDKLYNYIELRNISGFKAVKKRDRGEFYEFLVADSKIVKVNKDFCLITEIKKG